MRRTCLRFAAPTWIPPSAFTKDCQRRSPLSACCPWKWNLPESEMDRPAVISRSLMAARKLGARQDHPGIYLASVEVNLPPSTELAPTSTKCPNFSRQILEWNDC